MGAWEWRRGPRGTLEWAQLLLPGSNSRSVPRRVPWAEAGGLPGAGWAGGLWGLSLPQAVVPGAVAGEAATFTLLQSPRRTLLSPAPAGPWSLAHLNARVTRCLRPAPPAQPQPRPPSLILLCGEPDNQNQAQPRTLLLILQDPKRAPLSLRATRMWAQHSPDATFCPGLLPPGPEAGQAPRPRGRGWFPGPSPHLARPWLHPSLGPAAGSLSSRGLWGCQDPRFPQGRVLKRRGAQRGVVCCGHPGGFPRRPSPQKADPQCSAGFGRGPGREAAGVRPGGCGGIRSLLSPSCLPGGPQGIP